MEGNFGSLGGLGPPRASYFRQEGTSLDGAVRLVSPRYDKALARRSFAAADAAIDVFSSLHLGESMCVTGNGNPLEGQ